MANDAQTALANHMAPGGFLEIAPQATGFAALKALSVVLPMSMYTGNAGIPEQRLEDNPPSVFNSKTASASIAPQDYEGVAGYQRMLEEIRNSLYEEMPEMRGKVEIVDHTADTQAEIMRIAENLGVMPARVDDMIGPLEGEKGLESGFAMPTHIGKEDSYVCIASGWSPENVELTPENINALASVTVHEIFHCLDPMSRSAKPNEEFANYHSENATLGLDSRASELFADVGREALFANNGGDLGSIRELATNYDFGKPGSSSGGLTDMPGIAYDNGPTLRKLLDQYSAGGDDIANYHFDHWGATIDQVKELRQNAPNLDVETYYRDMVQAEILASVKKHVIEEAAAKLQNDKEFWRDQGVKDLTDQIDYAFDTLDYVGIKNGDYDHLEPEFQRYFDATIEARNAYIEWIQEHSEMIPASQRIVAADARIRNGHTEEPLPEIQDGDLSKTQIFGHAARYYQNNPDDPLANPVLENAFKVLINNRPFLQDQMADDYVWLEQVKDEVKTSKSLADALIEGKTINDCFEAVKVPGHKDIDNDGEKENFKGEYRLTCRQEFERAAQGKPAQQDHTREPAGPQPDIPAVP